MSNYHNSPQNPKPTPETPILLRMLHPTSGRENFVGVMNRPVLPPQVPVDPRLAMMINMQTQQAIAAANVSPAYPYQGFPIPGHSTYMYGLYQPYANLPRRS